MEWAVIFWLFMVALVVSGGLYVYFGLTAPAQETGGEMIQRGCLHLGAAVGALLVRWAVRWWVNR